MFNITPAIKNIGYDGDDIRTFSFSARVTHSNYPGVAVDFGGEPLVNLPRGADLIEYVQMQFTNDHAFVAHMTNALEFEFIKAGLTVESTPLSPEEQRALMPPISKRQLRLTLVRNGISLSDLDAAILAMGDEATIEWQDASEYRRLHPLLNQVAAHLSLKQEQVDAMWQQALTA